ncbi:MAG: alpha-amylase family glycosyl hydrolase [Planctomycetota bacterium]|jgi:1,4-alpha-glucan branching enzyme
MAQASIHPGMGARIYGSGTSFRVWAPFAESVQVAGQFNDWSATRHPLAHDGYGYWSCDVEGAAYRHEYKYVVGRAGEVLWKNDPYAREMTDSNGNSVIVDPSFQWGEQNGYGMPPWDELVIYEMHAGTFHDAPGGPPGTFQSVTEKLGYLANELSVNAVKVLPSAEFPMGHSLGYNPSHLFAIEREYGGPKAFRRMIRAAHEHGIAVILDVVYNHLGPGDLDLKRFDGWWQPTHPDGIYFYDRDRIVTPWGGPRPDYGRPEVRQFLRDNALFWLEEFQIDGLRFDATNYVRTINNDWRNLGDGWGLLRWINNEIDWKLPWKITIAEDLQNDDRVTAPTSEGGLGFDSQWDAGFVHPIRHALAAPSDEGRDLDAVEAAVYHRYNGDALKRVIYTESHDEVLGKNGKRRLSEDVWPGHADSWFSKKRTTLGAALVMTSPGIPMIFQGQEFLEEGAFDDYEPLDWRRRDAFAGLVTLYRDLIRLRRNWHFTTRGLRGQHVHVFHKNAWDKVIAYHRWHEGGPRDDVVVVLNLANRGYGSYRVGFPRPGVWRLRFNSDWRGYDPSFNNHLSYDTLADFGSVDRLPFSANVGLGPYTALIFSQDS